MSFSLSSLSLNKGRGRRWRRREGRRTLLPKCQLQQIHLRPVAWSRTFLERVRARMTKSGFRLVVRGSHWTKLFFLDSFDILIVFWGLACGHSEVTDECKHWRFKCEGEQAEEVAYAGEYEMSDSFCGAARQVSYVDNPGLRENEGGEQREREEGSQSNWVHGRSPVMC